MLMSKNPGHTFVTAIAHKEKELENTFQRNPSIQSLQQQEVRNFIFNFVPNQNQETDQHCCYTKTVLN